MCNCKKSKINRIIEGWSKVLRNENNEKGIERLTICRDCEKITIIGFCTICGCYCNAKVRVDEEACPIKKW